MIEYETKHWSGILFRLHGSVLPQIVWRVLVVTLVAALITYGEFSLGWELPKSRTLHAIVGVALGLLLVFRTNASYDRYWEGRIQVGAMVNNTRDLARQTASYLADSPFEVRERIGHLIIALFASIRRSLRRERHAPELADLLEPAECEQLVHASAPPLLVARWLSDAYAAEARAGRLSEERVRMIDAGVSSLVDLWGGAERILKTPVPFAYAHHIKGFLSIFCLTAPLALIDTMGWYTPLGAAVVAYGLYGIEEIGIEIEEPFGYDANDLPLDGIGQTIAKNVSEALGLRDDRAVHREPDAAGGVLR